MNITTIVIPAAGFGTRFLPFTKSVPKELLPLLHKPAIHEIITEGMRSGVNHFAIVISNEKQALKHYFTRAPILETALIKTGKLHLLDELNAIMHQCTFSFPIQAEMRGLGHALLMAKDQIRDDYFGVMLPDDIIMGNQPCMAQLMEVAACKQASAIIGVIDVPRAEISAYGSIKLGTTLHHDLVEVTDIIEKPAPEQAFSTKAIIGRYLLPYAIFDAIESIPPSASGEIQLTDALSYLIRHGHRVLAYTIKGTRFDLGRPTGWLEANLYLKQAEAAHTKIL